jgi:hypothetical protein
MMAYNFGTCEFDYYEDDDEEDDDEEDENDDRDDLEAKDEEIGPWFRGLAGSKLP